MRAFPGLEKRVRDLATLKLARFSGRPRQPWRWWPSAPKTRPTNAPGRVATVPRPPYYQGKTRPGASPEASARATSSAASADPALRDSGNSTPATNQASTPPRPPPSAAPLRQKPVRPQKLTAGRYEGGAKPTASRAVKTVVVVGEHPFSKKRKILLLPGSSRRPITR